MSRSGRAPGSGAGDSAMDVAAREHAGEGAASTPRRRSVSDLAARREEILDAATELFAIHGYSDAVTQALADRLGVGKGTVYRYFPSKRELFLASVDRVMRRLREHIDAHIEGVVDHLDRLARAIEAFLSFFERHPKFAELLIQERALFKDRERPTMVEHREVSRARWREVYRGLIAEGRLRDIPVDRITDVVGDLTYGTMFTNYSTGRQRPAAEQAQAIVDVVFFGILSVEEQKRRRSV
ncbi:MAG: TetR/AcrR family transcriptional regulator [Isosphaeraceae bacterium]